jgi:hypothetical protein
LDPEIFSPIGAYSLSPPPPPPPPPLSPPWAYINILIGIYIYIYIWEKKNFVRLGPVKLEYFLPYLFFGRWHGGFETGFGKLSF